MNNKHNFGGSKDIICVDFESLLVNVDDGVWWVNSSLSQYVAMMKEFFVHMKEVKSGDHNVCMDNNT